MCPFAALPDADARRSRETTLHCKCQAQVHARRSALPCPPTTDLGPDEIVRRDHELDIHRLRQTEYRACLLHYSHRMSRLSPAPKDPMQVDVPREPTPSISLPFFIPLSHRSQQAALHANWLPRPHTQFVIDKDGVLAAAPLYVPMHQQDIIHTFLDRVCDIGDDVHGCTLCLKCHHGMTLHNTLCARCHNEVRSPFSLVRTLTDILMPTVHKTVNSAANYADLARSMQNSTRSSMTSLRWRI